MFVFPVPTVGISILIFASVLSEESTKHAISSYCELIGKYPTLNYEDRQAELPRSNYEKRLAQLTYGIYLTLFGAALNNGSDGDKFRSLFHHDANLLVIVAASIDLFNKLEIMEDVNNIIFDSIWNDSHTLNFTFPVNPHDGVEGVDKMIKNIGKAFLDNPSMAPLYGEKKSKIEEVLSTLNNARNYSLPLDQLEVEMKYIVLWKAPEACYEVDRQKSNEIIAFRQHYLSQALIQLAKTDKVSRIQTLFDDAMKVVSERIQTSRFESDREEIFLSTLEEKLKMDPALEHEVTIIKNDLVKRYDIQSSL